jgi:hypothetical protein
MVAERDAANEVNLENHLSFVRDSESRLAAATEIIRQVAAEHHWKKVAEVDHYIIATWRGRDIQSAAAAFLLSTKHDKENDDGT